MQRILCPVDFSDFSRHAFDRALPLARANGASLTVLHVVSTQTAAALLPYVGPEAFGPFPLPEIDLPRITRDLRSFLAIDGSLDVDVTCEVAEAPNVPREILAQAERLRVDLVVMGTHGRSGLHRLMLGSVAETVLRKAPCPVLTVPSSLPDVVASERPFTRVLCAIDFSECSLLGLQYAISVAQQHGARLAVFHAAELVPPIYDPLFAPPPHVAGNRAAVEAAARERLHSAMPGAARETLRIEELVSVGVPHHEILKVANEWRSDLVVLGIHGRTAAGRLLFGSAVEPVVRQAPCPVLTVRPGTRAAIAAA